MTSTTSAGLSWFNVRFGLWSLFAWVCLGLALEAMHGLKVGWYLDFETRRLMWTLAHAHGVLLSMLLTGFGVILQVWPDDDASWRRLASGCLLAATLLLPLGFLLGGAFVHGGDPGLGVLLSPVGALALIAGLGLSAAKLRPPRS